MQKEIETLLTRARRLLDEMQTAVRLTTYDRQGTCPIFYNDSVFEIALPWAAIDRMQMSYVERRMPLDPLLIDQLIALIPTLRGRTLVDVGAFSGATAMILRHFLQPEHTHLIEPQNTLQDSLSMTILANAAETDTTLHQCIIDEADAEIAIGQYRPDRLSDIKYLRRNGGRFRAVALDSIDLGNVGLITLDYRNDKIYALRGGLEMITRERPFICVDISSGDLAEMRTFLEPLGYVDTPVGNQQAVFCPEPLK